MSRTLLVAAVVAAVGLAGCQTTNTSANVYRADQAQREQIVRMATVESIKSVLIEQTESGLGVMSGAALGGVAGSAIGQGRGSAVAAIAGAVAGGLLGNAAEAQIGRKQGFEITVRLDNGEMRAIVQDADTSFVPGERVRLLTQGGVTRVSK
ncbi:MAG: glycine zipper 2TM domain-containing protein [Burkholderiaceae bacterium]